MTLYCAASSLGESAFAMFGRSSLLCKNEVAEEIWCVPDPAWVRMVVEFRNWKPVQRVGASGNENETASSNARQGGCRCCSGAASPTEKLVTMTTQKLDWGRLLVQATSRFGAVQRSLIEMRTSSVKTLYRQSVSDLTFGLNLAIESRFERHWSAK
jgi:hypothetical protein